MKLYIKLLIVLFLFTGNACDKENDLSPEEQLPEATKTGANTAGCLVDGEVLLPKGGSLNSGSMLKAQYILNEGKYIFSLSLTDRTTGEFQRTVQIESKNESLKEGETYTLSELNEISTSAFYLLDAGFVDAFVTTNTIKGEFIFSRLDEESAIISGEFWFDAVNEEGEIVEIREGRFDVRY
ncbi:hypothetical protein APR41_06875 [Salegentibacter salinarum]|uniref:Uncharacterized protein n=1 Tax=Salegentibacter salinarum TaxID=447422 RepID=A0A2N0TQY8_9FLAO|nr:DUF6252 family protein [Salegentibacter salinarum]PKD17151.1 hypothetical protein APR41_06875 [Salegentibacter salinarum]SKB55674.1 hypothetical protein SAMN05660903_01401 [Salegentibacter salinarum]